MQNKVLENWGVIGHEKQIDLLKNVIARDKLFHTYLFIGPESIGKRLVATRFAQAVLVAKNGEIDVEHSAYRKIEHGNSDELLIFDDEKITIKQVRELQKKVQNKVYTKLFVILDGYENILPQAEQALLKLLEEPIENVHFILLAQSRKNILDTILSRAQILTFSPSAALQHENMFAMHLARQGLATEEENLDAFKESVELFTSFFSLDLIDRLMRAEEIAKKHDVGNVLNVWISVLHTELHAKLHGGSVVAELEKYSHKHLSKLILNFSAARSLLKKNVNKRLILENICLSF